MCCGVFLVRKVMEDTDYTMPNGQTYHVRSGDRVAMYPPFICKDPEIFEDPEVSKKHSQKLSSISYHYHSNPIPRNIIFFKNRNGRKGMFQMKKQGE